MSLGKKQYEHAYKRDNKRAVDEEIQSDFDSIYNDAFYDYWHEYYDYDNQPTLKDIAIGRLLTVLSKLRIRGSKGELDNWYW